jgi:hypothetical protein
MARPKALTVAAIAAAGLVVLTLAAAYSQRRKGDDLRSPPEARWVEAAPVEAGRCAISHAHFGSRRAQLVKVMRGEVPNFIVLEFGRRDPLLRLQRIRWLKTAYGAGEQTWLGEFGSAEAAMARAARLCPASSRCWPGERDCGPQDQPLTPAQAFMSSQVAVVEVGPNEGLTTWHP